MEINFCVSIKEKKRVDMYLSTLFKEFSRSYIQKMIDNGCIYINGKNIRKSEKIGYKDEIKIIFDIKKLEIKPENIKIDIVYDDENIIIINKDAGINTHPTPGFSGKSGTLVNALLYHVKNLSSIGGVERPGIVHRLDKDTSGLIMVAKNDKMMLYLQNLIKNKENIKKYYIAIVDGIVKEDYFKIETYIGRSPKNKIKMTSKNPINPKIAISYIKKLGIIENKYTVLEVEIKTGRTHQIRVHLSSIGHPILGDKVYGNKKTNEEVLKKFSLNRQALHAYKLIFDLYGEKKEFKADVKNDIKKILNGII